MSTNLYFGGFKKQKKLNPKILERARKNKITTVITPLQQTLSELYSKLLLYVNDKNTAKELIIEIANIESIIYMNIKLLSNVLVFLKKNGIESVLDLNTRIFNSDIIDNILDVNYERTDDIIRINKRRADFARYVFTILEFKTRQLENASTEITPELEFIIQNVTTTKDKKFSEKIEPRF